MSPLKNKLSLKTLGLVYPYEYDFKCHYNSIVPGHLNYFFLNKFNKLKKKLFPVC